MIICMRRYIERLAHARVAVPTGRSAPLLVREVAA
jgi:hypothetical protein